MLNLKNLADELKKKLQQGVSNVGNFAKQSSQLLPPVQAYNSIQQIKNIPNQISAIPYKLADAKIQSQMKNKMPADWSTPEGRQIASDKVMAAAPRWGQSFVPQSLQNIGGSVAQNPDSWTGSLNPVGQMQEFSNPLQRTYPKVETNPFLENIKQKVISGLKPEARQYLSNIPIQYGELDKGTLGQSQAKESAGRNVVISDTFNKPVSDKLPLKRQAEVVDYTRQQLETVIKHELLHQTPRLVPTELFHPKNQPVIDQYTERWGTDYMKQSPNALVEEMFAEESLPPAYYWHIFKKVNPKATQRNFVDTMKSYFVNSVNTPAPMSYNGVAPQEAKGVVGKQIKR